MDNKKQDQFQEEDQDWEDLAVIYYNFIGFMYIYICTHLSMYTLITFLICVPLIMFLTCYMYCKSISNIIVQNNFVFLLLARLRDRLTMRQNIFLRTFSEGSISVVLCM